MIINNLNIRTNVNFLKEILIRIEDKRVADTIKKIINFF